VKAVQRYPLHDDLDDGVDRGDGVETDGGGRYHVVCPDCTFEALTRHRHRAARAVDAHGRVEPSHDARFEEVTGR